MNKFKLIWLVFFLIYNFLSIQSSHAQKSTKEKYSNTVDLDMTGNNTIGNYVAPGREWQTLATYPDFSLDIDRINSKGWESDTVNIIYRLKFNKPKESGTMPIRDEETYSIIVDCYDKSIASVQKNWYFKKLFVQNFSYDKNLKRKITPSNKIEYTVASTACRSQTPDK